MIHKIGHLIHRGWLGSLTKGHLFLEHEKVDSLKAAVDEDIYQPPGEFSTAITSISKLIITPAQKNPFSTFWIVIAILTGGIGIVSYISLVSLPPLPNCQQFLRLSTDSARLYCSKLAAENNDKSAVIAAINVVKNWSEIDPLYHEGQNLLNEWSQQLITITKRELIVDGNMQAATTTLNSIPPQSAVYPDAQKAISLWRAEWHTGRQIEDKFKQAIQRGDWDGSRDQLNRVRLLSNNYWNNTRYAEMLTQLAQEREGWEQFQEAKQLAWGENFQARQQPIPEVIDQHEPVFYVLDPNVLAQAIAAAGQVKSGTYFQAQATAHRERWSQALIAIAREKLRVHQYAEALTVVQKVPKEVKAHSAAQLVATQASTLTSKTPQLPDSVDDLAMLTKAQQLGASGTITSLSAAIVIAQQIPADRPLAPEAQTFVKFWQQQIQGIQDRPSLDRAKTLAQQGRLEQAIKTAQSIQLAAYPTFQQEVAQWQQTLIGLTLRRDQQVLEQAQALYRQGRVAGAINTARRVPLDSPAYPEAERLLKQWSSMRSDQI